MTQQPESRGELVAGERGVQGEGTPGFSEFSQGFLHDERQVTIMWRGQFEGLLQLDLPGGALQQVGASNDMAHTLGRIVDDDGKLVGKDPVPTADHRISQRTQLVQTAALDEIHP